MIPKNRMGLLNQASIVFHNLIPDFTSTLLFASMIPFIPSFQVTLHFSLWKRERVCVRE